MFTYRVSEHKKFQPGHHSENILCQQDPGDVSIACHEPNQIGPYHAHPKCAEIYYCIEGGGIMRIAKEKVVLSPGTIIVHPPGELHEFSSGPERTILFRVRYGEEFASRIQEWPSNPEWKPEEN
jgi:mannose-6-phosphate isomerase-like protein (cupin superfamily)